MNYIVFIKIIITIFLLSIFSYTFYFSLSNIINYWTYTELHINYSLGFTKRGLLGTIMLYFEGFGLAKNIFFSFIFYLITFLNIALFLSLINRFEKNHIFFYIFFSLNPALILFSFYDLGGYARLESFGIFICLLHTFFSQKFYYNKINYVKYLKLLFIIIFPLSLITVLIHELNILFIFFHFFTAVYILNKNKFKKILNFKYLIFFNFAFGILCIFLFITNPFTKEFANILYNQLQDKNGIDFWIWESISLPFSDRLNYTISSMSGSVFLYFFIFLFYIGPIFFLLSITTNKNKLYLIYIIFSTMPFFFLFFIGKDWGRWIHIIAFVVFSCLIQFKEKQIEITKNYKNKVLTIFFLILVIFQFIFTRIPHCCNLKSLNLSIFGGIIPKIEIFYKILNDSNDLKKRFKTY